jgi:hypothetical protein
MSVVTRLLMRLASSCAGYGTKMQQHSPKDVDFPLDMFVFDSARQRFRQRWFTAEMLATTRDRWQQRLRAALEELPLSWAAPLLRDPSPDKGLAERNL